MKTLVLSLRRVVRHPAYAGWYEFEDLVVDLLDADLVEVQHFHGDLAFTAARRSYQLLRRAGVDGSHAWSRMARTTTADGLAGHYDLVFFVATGPFDFTTLGEIRPVLRATTHRVCWMVDAWAGSRGRTPLRAEPFDQFDRIYVANESGARALVDPWGNRVAHLAAGVDALAVPLPPEAELPRPILFHNPGRRSEPQHRTLGEVADRLNRLYLIDTLSGGTVTNMTLHRSNYLRRCRFSEFVIANHARFDEAAMIGGARDVSARFAEAAAGGAKVIGELPHQDSMRAAGLDGLVAFDWPLDGDAERLESIVNDSEDPSGAALQNMAIAAGRLDWAHQLDRILGDLGRPPTAALEARHDALRQRLAAIDVRR